MNPLQPRRVLVAVALGALALVLAACGSPAPSGEVRQQYAPPGPAPAVALPADATVSGALASPGGPYLVDRYGRVVILHGVNAVEKRPPFELYPSPGSPWNFTAHDAEHIAALGFNVVRLGITWQGLEPGTGGPNQLAVCSPGAPRNPHMFDPALARAYLAKVARTVALLGRYHVYTLLDMHQDVYNQAFRGEGAPAWAVCTGNQPVVALPGRWSRNYRNGALDVAVAHFWSNDVTGDLQGQYDLVWATVARYFADNPWIVGYDPYNEPFEEELVDSDAHLFAGLLQCFYTGRRHPGSLADATDPLTCPSGDPDQGVVPTIERADPHHLVFIEPDIYSSRGRPNLLGSMDFPRLVLNFHSYCGARSPVTGNPTDLAACAAQQQATLQRRAEERPLLASRAQPGGPAWFMSEFGATQSAPLVDHVTDVAAALDLGWAYWQWKYYDDPTGSSAEPLVEADGSLAPTAAVLSQPYAQAIAGTPVSSAFDAVSGAFTFVYTPDRRVTAPTVIAVPRSRYVRSGSCTRVESGRILSPAGSSLLLVAPDRFATSVQVVVAPGRCTARGPAAGG